MAAGTNLKFKVGVAVAIIFALITGILGIGVLYLFGIPLLGIIIGLVLVWAGNAGVKAKSAVTLSIIPVILIASLVSTYLSLAERETFLIPHGYRGEVVVFIAEDCGEAPVIENGRRLYNIPSSGVLITKAAKNKGYLNQKFFLVDEFGNRTEIPIFNRQNFETEKAEWGTYGRSDLGELTRETVGAFWAYGSQTYMHSRNSIAYRIYNYVQFESTSGKDGSLEVISFGKRAGELLNECRSRVTEPQ